MKVLVVDDSKSILAILKSILKEYKYEVTEAEDGLAGLQRLSKSDSFEFIMVDMNMPMMNGIDFIRCVRSNPKYTEIPIIMITTQSEVENIIKAMDVGATAYLLKPFTKDTIVGKLQQLGLLNHTIGV
jgi:two-component system, chemotaxis family, chemotaxis protein CheY